jgi:hypothetical protein
MKSNLHQFYKTDTSLETSGKWFELSEDVGFLVRRFGGANADKMKQALAKYHKPHAYQIQKGTLEPEKEKEILTRAFVESCITDWKGIEIDGEVKEFNKVDCVNLLLELPDLTDTLLDWSQNIDNFKEELGN